MYANLTLSKVARFVEPRGFSGSLPLLLICFFLHLILCHMCLASKVDDDDDEHCDSVLFVSL